MIGSGLIVSAVGGLLTAFTRPAAFLGLAGSAVLVAVAVGAWWGSDRESDRSDLWQAPAPQLEQAVAERDKRESADEDLAEAQARQIAGMRETLNNIGLQRDQALADLNTALADKQALEQRLAAAARQPKRGSEANAPAKSNSRPAAAASGWTPHSVRVFERARAKLRTGEPR